jgi:spore coat protein SA
MTSIAFVVPEMLPVPPVQGGAVEGWVHEVSVALAARGFDVVVLSRPAGQLAAPDGGVNHVAVPWSAAGRWLYERRRSWEQGHPLRPVVKALNVLAYGLTVRRRLRALRPDIVYVHNDPYLAALLGRRAGQSLVLHMHNDHLSARPARTLLAWVVARCDGVLCVSDFIRDRARAMFPGDAGRIHTVRNAIDPIATVSPAELPEARRPEAAFHFVFAGRLVPEKGVDVLLEAFGQLRRTLPQARLTIAGSSFFADAPRTPFERRLRQQAEALGGAVTFTGFIARERLQALYSEADAVVAPSTWAEPFGLVVLEAMARGACVIASRTGGLPELVDDQRTGLLVPPGDVDALARAMEQVATDPALARRLGCAAREEVTRCFPLPRLVGEIAAFFRGLAPVRGRPPLQTLNSSPIAEDS